MEKKEMKQSKINYVEEINKHLNLKKVGVELFEDDKTKITSCSIGTSKIANGYLVKLYYNLLNDMTLYEKTFCFKSKSEIQVFYNEVLKYLY